MSQTHLAPAARLLALAAVVFGACHSSSGPTRGLEDGGAPPAPGERPALPPRVVPLPSQAPVAEEERHVLVDLAYSGEGLRLLGASEVPLPLPRFRGGSRGAWRVVVEDAAGEPLYETRLDPPNLIRGEFEGTDGRIEGVRVLRPEATFAVRLPLLKAARRIRVYARSDTLAPEEPRVRGVERGIEVELGELDAAGVLR